jgi:hypothetical protein
LQKVDPVTNAKGLAPGQLDMYTWQLHQGLWQRSDWLECPKVHQSIQRIITFLFYVNTFLVGPQIEGTEFAIFDPDTNAKGPVDYVHWAVLPRHQAELSQAGMPTGSPK